MSVTLRDGPAKGVFFIKHAPLFLRAVVDKTTGDKDVLDQIDEGPRAAERVSVYIREGAAGHLRIRFGRGKYRPGLYALATYRHLPEVDGETLRENTNWQKWVMERPEVAQ